MARMTKKGADAPKKGTAKGGKVGTQKKAPVKGGAKKTIRSVDVRSPPCTVIHTMYIADLDLLS
jgi:hypothetical protein